MCAAFLQRSPGSSLLFEPLNPLTINSRLPPLSLPQGAGWQYARDFGVAPDDWVAEPDMLKCDPGEPIVRRRVWMRMLCPQSEYVRADTLLVRSLNEYKFRHRGEVKVCQDPHVNFSMPVK